MSSYVLIEIDIKDRDTYFKYIEKARPIVELWWSILNQGREGDSTCW
jgi:uncharacterized protein (DUF1330 family)